MLFGINTILNDQEIKHVIDTIEDAAKIYQIEMKLRVHPCLITFKSSIEDQIKRYVKRVSFKSCIEQESLIEDLNWANVLFSTSSTILLDGYLNGCRCLQIINKRGGDYYGLNQTDWCTTYNRQNLINALKDLYYESIEE